MTLLGETAKDGSSKKTRHDYCAAIRSKPVSELTAGRATRAQAVVADAAGNRPPPAHGIADTRHRDSVAAATLTFVLRRLG